VPHLCVSVWVVGNVARQRSLKRHIGLEIYPTGPGSHDGFYKERQ
jgi:hypothetical protein